jgi:hypothetical protein
MAGLNGDPVCKHRACFYLLIGAIDLHPEPEPPSAPAAPAVAACWACSGCGEQWFRGGYALPCAVCHGTGSAPLVAQAAALVAAAEGPAPSYVAIPDPDPAPATVGRAGHVAGYDVLMAGDALLVTHAASGQAWRHVVPNFGTALADLTRQPGMRLGWGRFPDDAEAIYVYDADDGNFGYAVNLSDPSLSEWGYAPFAGEEERGCDHCGEPLDADAILDDAAQRVCGACVETGREEARRAVEDAIHAAHLHHLDEQAAIAHAAA